MPVQLPFDSEDPFYRVGATLDDITYVFDVYWNGRDAAWYFDILDTSEIPIRSGVKIALGTPLNLRSSDPRRPTGLLTAVDLSGAGKDAGIDDLGARVVVMYFTLAEIEAGLG